MRAELRPAPVATRASLEGRKADDSAVARVSGAVRAREPPVVRRLGEPRAREALEDRPVLSVRAAEEDPAPAARRAAAGPRGGVGLPVPAGDSRASFFPVRPAQPACWCCRP